MIESHTTMEHFELISNSFPNDYVLRVVKIFLSKKVDEVFCSTPIYDNVVESPVFKSQKLRYELFFSLQSELE